MSRCSQIEMSETPEFGVILQCEDAETADQFEDFLTERCFVLFNIRPEGGGISFCFGQASTQEKVRELFARFLKQHETDHG